MSSAGGPGGGGTAVRGGGGRAAALLGGAHHFVVRGLVFRDAQKGSQEAEGDRDRPGLGIGWPLPRELPLCEHFANVLGQKVNLVHVTSRGRGENL